MCTTLPHKLQVGTSVTQELRAGSQAACAPGCSQWQAVQLDPACRLVVATSQAAADSTECSSENPAESYQQLPARSLCAVEGDWPT